MVRGNQTHERSTEFQEHPCKFQLENLGKLERKLTVRFPAEQFESQVRERMAELGRNVRLKGFRPGKVPTKVIEQRFGDADSRRSALGSGRQHLARGGAAGEAAAGRRHRTSTPAASRKTARSPTPPPSRCCRNCRRWRWRRCRSNARTAQVSEADIDTMIETLRKQRRSFEDVDRAAQAGDMVMFDYAAQAGDYRFPAEGRERAAT